MNNDKYTKLRSHAERTIKILDFIKAGKEPLEIVQKFADKGEVVQRALVDYYFKATNN